MGSDGWKVGSHEVQFEPPDIVIIRFSGPADLSDFKKLYEPLLELSAAHGGARFFLISDQTKSTEVSAEARHWVGRNIKSYPISGAAMFGAEPGMKTITSLVARGAHMMGLVPFPTMIVDSEAQARVWIEQQRQKPKG